MNLKMKKNTLLWILILFTGSQAQTPLTAEKAIELGLKNNYNIQIARNNAEVAENNRGYGRANFMPSLDAGGDYRLSASEEETNNTFSIGSSETFNMNGQITLNWTLFDGMRMFVDNAQWRELAKLGQTQARYTIENTVVAILAAYFNLVQQEQLLEVAGTTLDISETRFNKEQVRSELGGASSVDLLNAQVSYNEDHTLMLQRQLEVKIARKELNILLGQSPDTPLEVEKGIDIDPVTLSYDALLERARERNSALVLARQQKIIADNDIKLVRSDLYPRLSLNAGYSYADRITERDVSGEESFFPPRIESTTLDRQVGLMLSWNLFNGMRRNINIQNSRVESRNRELALREAEHVLQGLVKEAYLSFQQRLEIVAIEEQNVVAAEQNLELQSERYQVGSATSLEFRDAQVNLSRAQNTLIVARFQARIARLEIARLIGNINIM